MKVKVLYIDNKTYVPDSRYYLKRNQIYTLVGESNDFYYLLEKPLSNNSNTYFGYYKHRFVKIFEFDKLKIL